VGQEGQQAAPATAAVLGVMSCCWVPAAALQQAALQARLLLRLSNAPQLSLNKQQAGAAQALPLVGGACRPQT
jgi:hypothetical protein